MIQSMSESLRPHGQAGDRDLGYVHRQIDRVPQGKLVCRAHIDGTGVDREIQPILKYDQIVCACSPSIRNSPSDSMGCAVRCPCHSILSPSFEAPAKVNRPPSIPVVKSRNSKSMGSNRAVNAEGPATILVGQAPTAHLEGADAHRGQRFGFFRGRGRRSRGRRGFGLKLAAD